MDTAGILCLALLLDAAFGEPDWLWSRLPHPAVLMGRAVGWLDTNLNRGQYLLARGTLALALLITGAALTGWLIAQLGPWAEAIAAAILLAQKSLVQHVRAVADALRRSTAEGRTAVAMIVGRDTANMDDPAIARAAIESAAENLSDGVTAPAFWFLLFGLPGMAVYKAVNTADSMIGYRTPRHERFGKSAARLDDVLNLIPARLTSFLIALLHGLLPRWREIVAEARRHRSPNAGWPEAALARAIDTALSGPRAYHGRMQDFPWVHPDGNRHPGPQAIEAATRILWQVWAVLTASSAALALVG
ncbi:cobalamin biosynthesis protein CobD [Oceanicola sp. 22II-s10i]|uniref:adenosylcobinamide-phosphate synthase CbiB n=1 Tax=Oceanicola sp. 22II-s10i TaxID=1317116 RepID=UPI000B5242C1|nr:adenosylcobinamide-phosphate synthase CbiB [Oceanicola sp. 22II-s10i]OWU86514.1 cobalamin biosynthesis protein CobD [Oceanicola sp. 22II-s10i]